MINGCVTGDSASRVAAVLPFFWKLSLMAEFLFMLTLAFSFRLSDEPSRPALFTLFFQVQAVTGMSLGSVRS